jgi:hypothetical protein
MTGKESGEKWGKSSQAYVRNYEIFRRRLKGIAIVATRIHISYAIYLCAASYPTLTFKKRAAQVSFTYLKQ